MEDENRNQDKRKTPGSQIQPPKKSGGFLILLLIIIFFIFVIQYGQGKFFSKQDSLSPYKFEELLQNDKIKKMVVKGNTIEGEYIDDEKSEKKSFKTVYPERVINDVQKFDQLMKWAKEKNVKFEYQEPSFFLYQILLPLIPWILLIFLAWFFFFRSVKSAVNPGNVLSFGKSKAKLASKEQKKTTFADVAGVDEAKEEVAEVIEFLKNTKRFQKIGGRIPRGILLVGAPGTGKTLLAKAVAGEAGVPFLSISGSDFVEMFVGVGASRVRDLFNQAKQNSPCIVFLDEIDAVGRKRGTGLGGGHDEREQTLNQILVEMDGFDTDDGVIVFAATNRPDILDPALLRPGRFDREIVLDLPDVKGREEILKVHARKVKVGPNVDFSVLAKTTPMFSGADLEAVVNESAIIAAMKGKEFIEQEDLEEGRDKVRWGRQKRSRVMDESDKKVTAFHEAGHTLVSKMLPGADPIHKVTIIPRGPSLGSTMRLPEKDRYHLTKKFILANITVLYGGRCAEEIFLNDISAGARNDIKEATDLARAMICEWGMSDTLGPVAYSEIEEHLFLGREITKTKTVSDNTAETIDKEIKSILENCYNKARNIILENKDLCEKITSELLKHETLSGQDIDKIFDEYKKSETKNYEEKNIFKTGFEE